MRRAYLGLSYPLWYDYVNPVTKKRKYLGPNPIIESPLGLMILYDELVFLCKDICPKNMRKLPYVKFVDEILPEFYFSGILEYVSQISSTAEVEFTRDYSIPKLFKQGSWRLDTHTHNFNLGDIEISARSDEYSLIFDIEVFNALKELFDPSIEFVNNSNLISANFHPNVDAEFAESILIPDIPNYYSVKGPYHKCMDELRENPYLTDFRKWIANEHAHLQRNEISERSEDVQRIIQETRNNVFKRYLEDNNYFKALFSSSKTIVHTGIGIVSAPFSIYEGLNSVKTIWRNAHSASSVRWQGFVTDGQKILNNKDRC